MTSVGWTPSLRGTKADAVMLRDAVKSVFKHRWAAYLTITLIMVATMVFGGGEFANAGAGEQTSVSSSTAYGSTPVVTAESGYATLGDNASPAEVAAQVKGASSLEALNFLTFSRWHGANTIPSPNVAIGNVPAMLSAGMVSIGGMLMTIASTVMWLMGVLLSLAISTNLMSQLANTIDHSFAIMGNNILASGAFIALMAFILVAITIGNFIRGNRRSAFLGFAVGVMALLALMGMTSQASSNHNDTLNGRSPSPIAARESDAGPSGTGIIVYNGDPFESPNDWAAWSPGWIMAQSNYLLKGASGAVIGGINSVSNAIGSVGVATDRNSMCGRYIDGMYTIYDSIDAVKNNPSMQVLKSYDLLARAVYFNTYVTAAYGNSDSARNVWCRMSESNGSQPMGEQALISRKAGIYTEAVGVEGSDYGNAFVAGNGSWRNPGLPAIPDQNGKTLASDFFGTSSYNLTSNTRMLYYFAACTWPTRGGTAQVLPAWNGVIVASSGKVDSIWSVDNVFDIFGDMTGQNGITNANCSVDPMNVDFGFGIKDHPLASGDNKGGRAFDYSIDPTDLIYTVTGGVVTPYDRHFMWPVMNGNDNAVQAQSFYRITQGGNSSGAILFGLVPLILVVMMAKYILPLILGALVAQVMATALLILLPLTIISLMIPLPIARKWLGLTGLTVLYSFLVTLLFLAITTITLMIIHVLMWVFAPLASGGAALSAGGLNGSILLMIQVGLAVFIGLKTVKMILSKAFAIDMSSLKNATMSAGLLSGGAILGQMGMSRPQVLNMPSGVIGDDTKRKYEELKGRLNSRNDQKPGSTDDFLNDKAKKSKSDAAGLSDSGEGLQSGLGGKTSDFDLADVASTGAGVIGAAAMAAKNAGDGSSEPNFIDDDPVLGNVDPIETARGMTSEDGAPVLGAGAGSVIPQGPDVELSPEQRNMLSNQVAEMSDNLLGGAAPNSQANAISQPGDAGDYAALGTDTASVEKAIAAQSIDTLATNGGASPFTDPSAVRGNFDDLIAKQDAMRASMKYADPRSLADRALTGSAHADFPLGVDENGAPVNLASGVARDGESSSAEDWLYSPMALFDPYFDGEQTSQSLAKSAADPVQPEAVETNGMPSAPKGDHFDLESSPFISGDGYWNTKSNEMMNLGSEPQTTLTWEGREFDLADITGASSAAMAPENTGLSSSIQSLKSSIQSLGERMAEPQIQDVRIERFTTNELGVEVRSDLFGDAAREVIDEFAAREASGTTVDPSVDRIVIHSDGLPVSPTGLQMLGSAARATGRGTRELASLSKWFFDTL